MRAVVHDRVSTNDQGCLRQNSLRRFAERAVDAVFTFLTERVSGAKNRPRREIQEHPMSLAKLHYVVLRTQRSRWGIRTQTCFLPSRTCRFAIQLR